jgi:2-dehydropantoate 2-reductase
MRSTGLTLHDASGTDVIPVSVVERIDEVDLAAGDAVILAMKTQDTEAALDQLARHAPPGITVACAQNGVENERLALRRFGAVNGICVMLPATFLEPGIVDAHGAPHNAILDIGRYPDGTDEVTAALSAAFEASGLASRAIPNVMAAKYGKLVMNLGNVVDALVADPEACVELLDRARQEATACFAAAGIAVIDAETDRERRRGVMELVAVDGRTRGGGSTWQSVARGASSTEVDWLNGEIVLLGRLHGVATPVNTMLCELARSAVARGARPRSIASGDLVYLHAR